MKRILMLVCLLGILGCVPREVDISTKAAYAPMIGKRYLLKRDMIVFHFAGEDRNKLYLHLPQASDPAFSATSKPLEYNTMMFVGILPSGTVLTITNISQRISTVGGVSFYATVTKTENKEYLGKEVSMWHLISADVNPSVLSELAQEIKP